MKHLITILSAFLILFPAVAQQVDTTSTLISKRLELDESNAVGGSYFEQVKAHLSAEGRKNWKPEFSVRAVGMFYHESATLTGGIRTSPNKVFGLGLGHSWVTYDANPAQASHIDFFLYHRHYIPLDRKRRISLYSDLMFGGAYVYEASGYVVDGSPRAGVCRWYFSWEPGLSIRLWGKSNLFLGPTIGPSIGLHFGLAI